MSTPANSFIHRNSVFLWVALATGFILLVPLVGMQFSGEVNWSPLDFAAMGVLVYGAASVFILAARKVSRTYWPAIGAVVVAGFLYVWAELAVGIFTNLGS